jgi:glycosyltransferase involved in cell wall biosynthesis
MNREKGADAAARIARRAGVPLVMVGPIATREWDPDFYEHELQPLIDGEHVVYVGERGTADLDRLYRGASCLLSPIQWEEPFGLAVVEAMARGVPVIGTARGALTELIEPDVTGYLVETEDEALRYISEAVAHFDRIRCHVRARERFSWEVTGKAYLDLIWGALREDG